MARLKVFRFSDVVVDRRYMQLCVPQAILFHAHHIFAQHVQLYMYMYMCMCTCMYMYVRRVHNCIGFSQFVYIHTVQHSYRLLHH